MKNTIKSPEYKVPDVIFASTKNITSVNVIFLLPVIVTKAERTSPPKSVVRSAGIRVTELVIPPRK